jgi:hypothetical protein
MMEDDHPPAEAPLPCVIDIEASGFGRGSYPIEIGIALPNGAALCTLVRPMAAWTHWDPAAERLHGLSREMLLRHGREPAEVAARLNQSLAGESVYTDGWAHDYTWLAILFDAAGCAPSFRLCHLHELLAEPDLSEWDRACLDARAELASTRHRASADARALQRALCRMRRHTPPDWQPTGY